MNAALLVAMLWVLATWVLMAAVLTGWGAASLRLFGLRSDEPDLPWWAFWTGFGSLVAFLQLWHFFRPVDGWAAAISCVVGLAGLFWARSGLCAAWRHWRARPRRAWPWLLLLAGLWLANQACAPNTWGDSFSYHLSAVQWTRAYPVVPGLVNLHLRLGYNSSAYLFLALADQGPWAGRYTHFAYGAFAWAGAAYVLESAYGFLETNGAARWRAFFGLGWLMPLLAMVRMHWLSTTATDFLGVCLVLVASAGLLELADREVPAARRRYLLLNVALAVALAVTVKSTSMFFAAAAGLLAVWFWWRGSADPARSWRWPLVAAVLSATLVVPWLARNVILTGYPLFPSTVAGLPVDWREPPEQVALRNRGHRDFILGTSAEAAGWGWLGKWWRLRMLAYEVRWWALGPLIAAAAGVLVLLPRLNRWRQLAEGLRRGAWLGVPAFLALAAWLLLWPDPRYAAQFFWVLTALVWALAAALWCQGAARRRLCLVLALWLIYGSFPFTWQLRSSKLWVAPGPDLGFHPAKLSFLPPQAEGRLVEFVTDSGLRVQRLGADGWACAETPLLYAPEADRRLRLRRAGDLSAGFTRAPDPRALP